MAVSEDASYVASAIDQLAGVWDSSVAAALTSVWGGSANLSAGISEQMENAWGAFAGLLHDENNLWILEWTARMVPIQNNLTILADQAKWWTQNVGQFAPSAVKNVGKLAGDLDALLSGDSSKIFDALWESFWKIEGGGGGVPAAAAGAVSGGAAGASRVALAKGPVMTPGGLTSWTPAQAGLPLAPYGSAGQPSKLEDLAWKTEQKRIRSVSEEFGETVGKGKGVFVKYVLPMAADFAKGQSEALLNYITPQFKVDIDTITGRGMSWNDPLQADLFSLFTSATIMGMQAHALSVIGSFKIYGIGFDLGPLAAFFAELADYGRILTPYINAFVDCRIGIPARRQALQAYRPTRPGPSELRELVASDHITKTQYEKGMAVHGFSDDWIKTLYEDSFVHPTMRELTVMVESGLADDPWIFDKMRERGYKDKDASRLLVGLRQRATRSVDSRYLTQATAQRTEGYTDRASYKTALGWIGLSEEQIAVLNDAAEMQLRNRQVDAVVSVVTDAASRDLMPMDVYQSVLALLVPDTTLQTAKWVGMLIKRYKRTTLQTEQSQQQAFEAQVRASVPKYLQAYKRGQMTTSDLHTLLLTSGLMTEIADVVVLNAKAARLAELGRQARELGIPDARDQYIMGFASDAQYLAWLRARGLPPATVDLEMAIARAKRDTRIDGKIRTQFLAPYEEGYAQGLITADELSSVYEALQLDDRASVVRMALAEAKRRTKQAGTMGNADLVAWINAVGDNVVSAEDFITSMQFAAVALPVQENSLALVPVFQAKNNGWEITDSMFRTLLDGMKLGLLSENMMPDWAKSREQRRLIAQQIAAQGSEPRYETTWAPVSSSSTTPGR